jgi:hypothetical protein
VKWRRSLPVAFTLALAAAIVAAPVVLPWLLSPEELVHVGEYRYHLDPDEKEWHRFAEACDEAHLTPLAAGSISYSIHVPRNQVEQTLAILVRLRSDGCPSLSAAHRTEPLDKANEQTPAGEKP